MILRNSEKKTQKATGYLREGGESCLKDRHVHSQENTHEQTAIPVAYESFSVGFGLIPHHC